MFCYPLDVGVSSLLFSALLISPKSKIMELVTPIDSFSHPTFSTFTTVFWSSYCWLHLHYLAFRIFTSKNQVWQCEEGILFLLYLFDNISRILLIYSCFPSWVSRHSPLGISHIHQDFPPYCWNYHPMFSFLAGQSVIMNSRSFLEGFVAKLKDHDTSS